MIWNGHARVNPPPRQYNNESSDELDSYDEEIDEIDESIDWSYVVTNQQLYNITKTQPIQHYFSNQQQNWISHVIRRENNNIYIYIQ